MQNETAEKPKEKKSKTWLLVAAGGLVLAVTAVIFFAWSAKQGRDLKQTDTNTESTVQDGQDIPSGENSFIDTHAHVITPSYSLTSVMESMKKYDIDKMVIMQFPVDLFRYQGPQEVGIPEAAEKYSDSFAVLYQGEAIKLLHEVVNRGTSTPEEENRFKLLTEEAAASGKYVGFGEIALRHYPQPNLTGEQKKSRDITIPGDHQFLLDLSDIAAKYNMVLDIHIEPDDNTLSGFEKLVSHNPQTKIIFDHAGWYNTGEGTATLFSDLLGKYPNLYASIKIRKPANPNQLKVAILQPDGSIGSDWLEVFRKYPERFVIGSDVKFGLETEEGNVAGQYEMIKKFLGQLPDDLRQKIGRLNAKAVFNLP